MKIYFRLLCAFLFVFVSVCLLNDKSTFADPISNKTRFGTFANFRQNAGSPNFTNRKVYEVIDGDKYLKNEVYCFIGPDGKPVVQSNDWRKLIRQQPDSSTREWWDFQLKQMMDTGLSFLIIDNFGLSEPYDCDECSQVSDPNCLKDSHNLPLHPEFQAEALKKILSEEKLPLQVGLFVDTPGPYHMYNWDRLKAAYGAPENWCQYRYFGAGKGKDPKGVIQPMPITPENALHYMYDAIIFPFYSHFNDPDSRTHWLTDNGKPLTEGGRPIIWIYGTNPQTCSDFGQSGAAFTAIKDRFQKDFGVEPFLVIETQWFKLSNNDPSLLAAADATESFIGDWLWGRKNPPDSNSWLYKGYRISRIVPGLKAPSGHWGKQNIASLDPVMGKRWKYIDGTEGADESYFLQREWNSGMKDKPDLAIIGFWDDQEGESIAEMADYEKKGGGFLPPDYYIKKVRSLIDHYRSTGTP